MRRSWFPHIRIVLVSAWVAVVLAALGGLTRTALAQDGDAAADAAADTPAEVRDAATEPGTAIEDPFNPLPPADEDAADGPTGERTGNDRVYLDDGTLLEGRLKGYRDDRFVFTTPSLGDVEVDPTRIARVSLVRDRVFYLQQFAGGASRAVVLSVSSAGQLTMREANAATGDPIDVGAVHVLSDVPIPVAVWTVTGSFTVSSSFGNVEAVTLGAELKLIRLSRMETLELYLGAAFTEIDGVVSEQLFRGGVVYRFFFSEWFGVVSEDRVRRDEASGLSLRNSARLGITWRPFLDGYSQFTLDLGLTYVYEDLLGSSTDYLGLFASSGSYFELSTRIALSADFTYQMDLDNAERFILSGEIVLHFTIDEVLSLSARVEDMWVGKPASGFQSNDIRLFAVLNLKFDL